MQTSFKVLTIMVAVALGLSAWLLTREVQDSTIPEGAVSRDVPAVVDNPVVSERANAEAASGVPVPESGRAPARDDAPNETADSGLAESPVGENAIRSALRYEQPILAALEWDMASQDDSETSPVVENAAVWMTICENVGLVSQVNAEEGPDREATAANLETFCEGFSENTKAQIEQLVQDAMNRISRGERKHPELMQLSETRGAGAAVDAAIASMPAALQRLDYARLLELVWLAGLLPSISSGPRDPALNQTLSSDTQVAFAVSASLYCRHVGGCRSDHPVVLLLCQQMWPDRRCSAPRDIHDAIRQVLTGVEHEAYLSMVDFITARIGNVD